jgi:D-alanyl-D-alanine carboxypeptidase
MPTMPSRRATGFTIVVIALVGATVWVIAARGAPAEPGAPGSAVGAAGVIHSDHPSPPVSDGASPAPAVTGSASPPATVPAGAPGNGIDPRTLLVWVPWRLPASLAGAAGRVPGVATVVQVTGGTAWMTAATSRDGTAVERPPAGYRIPIDVGAADPAEYAALYASPPAALADLARRPGEGLFASAETTLRRIGAGGRIAFGPVNVPVAGAVSDAISGYHELFVTPPTAARLGLTSPKYLLVLPRPGAPIADVERRLRALVRPPTKVLVTRANAVPFDRDSPNTLPASLEKLAMGEFAARQLPGGTMALDPAWTAAHIETADVPVLGRVTCNRAFVPILRTALAEVERRGLASTIHPGQYAGCFVPKFVLHDPTQIISHHTWGSAFDINVPENGFGAPPHEDLRLVSVFESLGFQWGGRWMVPDGMHFEFLRAPPSG